MINREEKIARGRVLAAAKQAAVTAKCGCSEIAPNLEHGEHFTCSKCGATWHARYKGHLPTLTLEEQSDG